MSTAAEPEVLIRVEGRAGRITMNRPKALNALTLGMVRDIWRALLAWQSEPSVEVVLLDGAGERALCAGGDVISLYNSRGEGSGLARTFWREEYRLNALIHRYGKPFVAFQDGIVMGGGIGLSSHARHRIVTERAMLAMPETGIGLIPDVGGTWLLAHAPGELGVYLGLTGQRMSGPDAIEAGFSGMFAPSSGLGEIKRRLSERGGAPVEEILEEIEENPVPPSPLMALKPDIDRLFASATVEGILHALSSTTLEWAQKRRTELLQKSPLALKATLAAIRQARHLPSLEAALNVEFRLCTRLFENGEFPEGVRALLVDKDKSPRWGARELEEVTAAAVAALFEPLAPAEELGLAAP
jgi:enoyl-CoA hydratase